MWTVIPLFPSIWHQMKSRLAQNQEKWDYSRNLVCLINAIERAIYLRVIAKKNKELQKKKKRIANEKKRSLKKRKKVVKKMIAKKEKKESPKKAKRFSRKPRKIGRQSEGIVTRGEIFYKSC